MTAIDRVNAISEQGLCSGCGLCESIAGEDVIRVTRVANGYERPVVRQSPSGEVVDSIYESCPSLNIGGLPEELLESDTEIDPVWGPVRELKRAHATSPATRFEASTGGVLTALAQYLLDSNTVDFVLQVATSDVTPAFGDPVISERAEDAFNAAGSRYGPAAPLRLVHAALDREQPFAFVGKPCDVAAVRNLAKLDTRVGKYLKVCLTMVCGGTMVPAALDEFLQRQRIGDDVKSLRYRGKGCPGPTTITTSREQHDFHYLDFWGEDESAWQLPFRCKICPDGIGEAADIAAADTWPGGSPSREESETDPGSNAVIARTRFGSRLIQAAEQAGYLSVEHDLTIEDLDLFQPHQVRKKYAAFDRIQGLADVGGLAPEVDGLRIQALAETRPAEEREQARTGTRLRVENGNAAEATPTDLNEN